MSATNTIRDRYHVDEVRSGDRDEVFAIRDRYHVDEVRSGDRDEVFEGFAVFDIEADDHIVVPFFPHYRPEADERALRECEDTALKIAAMLNERDRS